MIKIKKIILNTLLSSIFLFIVLFLQRGCYESMRESRGERFRQEVFSENFEGIIIEKYKNRTSNLKIKANQFIYERSFVTSELYNLSSLGDTIIKIKNTNKCYLIHNGKEVYLNYTYYRSANFVEGD